MEKRIMIFPSEIDQFVKINCISCFVKNINLSKITSKTIFFYLEISTNMASNSFSRLFIKLAANAGCAIMAYSFYEYDKSFVCWAVCLRDLNLGCTRKKTVWENMRHSNSKFKRKLFKSNKVITSRLTSFQAQEANGIGIHWWWLLWRR